MKNTSELAGRQLSGEELHKKQAEVRGSAKGPVVIATGIENLFNVASVLRNAEAVRCEHVYFVDTQMQKPEKLRKVSRTTSNLVGHTFLTYDQFFSMYKTLPEMVAIEITTTSQNIFLAHFDKNISLVIGSERHGIPEEILGLCTQALHIPMLGINSSLNVATSLGIVLYEWYRKFELAEKGH